MQWRNPVQLHQILDEGGREGGREQQQQQQQKMKKMKQEIAKNPMEELKGSLDGARVVIRAKESRARNPGQGIRRLAGEIETGGPHWHRIPK